MFQVHALAFESGLIEKCRYMTIFISTWVLLTAGLVFALPMIHWRVMDHTEDEIEYA